MLELTDWFGHCGFLPKPWLMLGKGPTFERRGQIDLGEFNLLALNHVVNELPVDVAHIIDIDVVADCADHLQVNADWLVMPRYPHVQSALGDRALEDYFGELPVLRELAERGRLVWYNLAHTPSTGASPVIGARYFSSEAALNILGQMGVKTVRSLGVDGGRSYAPSFEHLEGVTLLANNAPAFDRQFELLEVIADEHGLDYRPLVEPLRIFVGVDDSELVAYRVLEYSIRKSASIPVEVVPLLDVPLGPLRTPPEPIGPPRRSFSPFAIPELCEFHGRGLSLDADTLVFGDVAELADLPFGPYAVLRPEPTATHAGNGYPAAGSVSVMLLDCERLPWHADEIIGGVDEGRYASEQLLSDLCIVAPDEIGNVIPSAWNHLEQYDPGRTKLLCFPVAATQPWKNDRNPLDEIWMSWYREAVEAGAVPPHEVESLIAAGHAKPSLQSALRLAPSRRSVFTNASRDLDLAQRHIALLEKRIAAMQRSSSWRIGTKIVRALQAPARLVRRH